MRRIVGIATIKERISSLEIVIDSIKNQVDKIIVYQSGYKENIDYLNDDMIEVYSSLDMEENLKNEGKFYKMHEYVNDYYFTIDDDIIYPDDYIDYTISKMKEYKNDVIISYHGRIIKDNAVSYYRDYDKFIHFSSNNENDEIVEFPGTGVMCIVPCNINFNLDDFEYHNMGDVHLGLFAKKLNKKVIVPKHHGGWLKPILTDSPSIFSTQVNDDRLRTLVAMKIKK